MPTPEEEAQAIVDHWDTNNGMALLGDHRDDLIHVFAAALKVYVYIQSEKGEYGEYPLFTVGFYTPDGRWVPETDHSTREEAAQRVHYLNGGGDKIMATPEEEAQAIVKEWYQTYWDMPKPLVKAIAAALKAREAATWEQATMIIHEVPRQSDTCDEVVKNDRLRLVQALAAAQQKGSE